MSLPTHKIFAQCSTIKQTRKWTSSICTASPVDKTKCGGEACLRLQMHFLCFTNSLPMHFESKSPTSFLPQKGSWPARSSCLKMTISVPNQISLTFFFILQGTIQVFRGGCWRLLDPDGIRSPWKNVQLYAWISDQKTGKPHLSISAEDSW